MTEISRDDLATRFATRAVHAGKIADPLAGAVMTPIYQTSTYVQDGLGRHKGYEYARTRNPTREALERNVAALEGGRHGFAFASGLAAVDGVLKLLAAGDHVVSGDNVYGGTHRQTTLIWSRVGLEFSFVTASDTRNVAAARVHPERVGRGARTVRLLARGARHQDAGAAHATARRQRPPHRGVAHKASQGRAGLLSGTAVASPARAGVPANERVRRDDLGGAGLARAGQAVRRAHPHFRTGRVAGGCGEPDRAPGLDDARQRARGSGACPGPHRPD